MVEAAVGEQRGHLLVEVAGDSVAGVPAAVLVVQLAVCAGHGADGVDLRLTDRVAAGLGDRSRVGGGEPAQRGQGVAGGVEGHLPEYVSTVHVTSPKLCGTAYVVLPGPVGRRLAGPTGSEPTGGEPAGDDRRCGLSGRQPHRDSRPVGHPAAIGDPLQDVD